MTQKIWRQFSYLVVKQRYFFLPFLVCEVQNIVEDVQRYFNLRDNLQRQFDDLNLYSRLIITLTLFPRYHICSITSFTWEFKLSDAPQFRRNQLTKDHRTSKIPATFKRTSYLIESVGRFFDEAIRTQKITVVQIAVRIKHFTTLRKFSENWKPKLVRCGSPATWKFEYKKKTPLTLATVCVVTMLRNPSPNSRLALLSLTWFKMSAIGTIAGLASTLSESVKLYAMTKPARRLYNPRVWIFALEGIENYKHVKYHSHSLAGQNCHWILAKRLHGEKSAKRTIFSGGTRICNGLFKYTNTRAHSKNSVCLSTKGSTNSLYPSSIFVSSLSTPSLSPTRVRYSLSSSLQNIGWLRTVSLGTRSKYGRHFDSGFVYSKRSVTRRGNHLFLCRNDKKNFWEFRRLAHAEFHEFPTKGICACRKKYLVWISGRFFANSETVSQSDDVFGSSKTFLGILKTVSPSSRSSSATIPNLWQEPSSLTVTYILWW